MGGALVERLLEALVARLPRSASDEAVAQVIRAAAEALPESKAKTRSKLFSHESEYVERLQARLKEEVVVDAVAPVAAEGGDTAAAAAEDEAPDVPASAEDVAAAAYAGVDSEDPQALIDRCRELLSRALAALRPARRAEAAIAGLLAMLPAEATPADEGSEFGLQALQSCARLMPTALAAFAGCSEAQELRPLGQLMGFILAAPARLPEPLAESDEVEARVLAARFGGLAALASSTGGSGGAIPRAALRVGLSSLGHPLSPAVAARLAPALPPVIRVGFGPLLAGGASAASEREDLQRGDLLALLYSLRLLGLCRVEGVVGAEFSRGSAFAEARDALVSALEVAFDATPLPAQLRTVAAKVHGKRGIALKKKLAGSAARSRAGAAAIVAEVFESVPRTSISHATLRRLADCSGLPVGDDEELDRKAAAARAKGELFFEDTAGNADADADADDDEDLEGGEQSAIAAAEAAVGRRTLGKLEGVEALRSRAMRNLVLGAPTSEAPTEKATRANRETKRKVPAEEGDGDGAKAPEAAADSALTETVTTSPKKRRLRRKTSVSADLE